MPRTEKGPANRRSREWDPTTDGRSPIKKGERPDARFLNSTSKPPAVEDEPWFDRGRFKTGHRLDYVDYRLPDYEKDGRLKFLTSDTNTGAAVPAVCEGASCGGNVSAKITGRKTSYKELIAAAVEAINFAVEFHKRWNQAATSYVDNRTAEKARRVTDETWRGGDETADYVSTQPNKHVGRRCPVIFYEKPFLCVFLFWLMAGLRCDEPAQCWCVNEPLRDFWLFAADATDEIDAPELHHAPGLARILSEIETGLTLGTWTPMEAKKRNRAKRQKPRRPGLLTDHEELELARRGKAGDIPARDEIIARHWPLVQRKCRHVSVADQADAIAVGMAALLKAWKAWEPDHDRGVRFGTFAAEAVEWAIKDFMRQRRRQVPVAQSINANDPDTKSIDLQRAENNMMTNTERQASIAKRRLVAERLWCLNPLQQRVIAQRLGLLGYQPLEQEQIADQLGMSERQIRRIEKAAEIAMREQIAGRSKLAAVM